MGDMRDTSNMGDYVGMARVRMGDMRDTSNMGDQVGMTCSALGTKEIRQTWVTR